MAIKDKIFKIAPVFIQNGMISLFNYLAYRKRYGGKYKAYLKVFKKNRDLTLQELKDYQKDRYSKFIQYALKNSRFYGALLNSDVNIDAITDFPIVQKEILRKEITNIYTIENTQGIVSKTGGTTGKSLEVLFTLDNMQERFAMLDDFRSRFGYKLGKKTAWFSGKNLLSIKDVKKNRFWKSDYLYKVQYYSTFHIKEEYLKYYVENLIQFKPEYIVGFPSSVLEIAKYGIKNGYDFPSGIIKAIFPTAETVTDAMRQPIESFFKAKMYNQYASSEGAPFIFECTKSKLHLELQSGVFEVLDEDNQPAKHGKLVVTSFTTEGTPLIRYDIGDSIELSDEVCDCGNNNPLVHAILGRVDDYVYSIENGKINLGNVSNTLKDTNGIVKFQATQDQLDRIKIKVIVDEELYNSVIENIFIKNWKDRVGNETIIEIEYVEDIPNETSGKYRMVKNNIKHLI